jgi:TolB-like protein/Tfp pilus assembly protein PilF
MPDVFISYAKTDRSHALDLAGELRAHGFTVWIDQGSIPGAKNWSAEIVDAIDACSTMLCLLSPNSIRSHNVAREIHLASEKQKHILPVVLEKVALPSKFEYPLAGLQRVHYLDRAEILRALALLQNGVEATEQSEPITIDEEDTAIRIAVLPFDDLSPEHDNQWFADGMMDELISTLGSLDRVKIPSRSDVLHYREHRKQSREIARELGVRYLIEGGVRKSNHKIRINASLIDTLPGEQLWMNKFDGTFEDVFAFQESVSINITAALKLKLTQQEIEQVVEEHGTQNSEAYELYLKGRHEQYYCTKESYLRALELYEQAAVQDPKFAKAYINIAQTCCAYYREYSKNLSWLKRAEDNLEKAWNITGETSRTLMIQGMVAWQRGELDHAIEMLRQSGELDPKNYNAFDLLGSIYMARLDYHKAINEFQRVVDLVEDYMAYYNLLVSLASEKDISRLKTIAEVALPVFDRYLLREPSDASAAIRRAFIFLWAGQTQEAELAGRDLLASNHLTGVMLFDLGCLFNGIGDLETFVSLIRKSIHSGFRDLERMRNLVTDPDAANSRDDLLLLLDEIEKIVEEENKASATPSN